eukprot:2528925-Amphidinium_carterae.1
MGWVGARSFGPLVVSQDVCKRTSKRQYKHEGRKDSIHQQSECLPPGLLELWAWNSTNLIL